MEWPKSAHELPMGSLNKVNTDEELRAWVERCDALAGDLEVVRYGVDLALSEKLDGISIELLYDHATSPTPILSGVDNLYVTAVKDVFVAEDGGNMELVVLTPEGEAAPLLRVIGQDGSELTGPAFHPSGNRLYFSSQRGGPHGTGITYEVSGPFRMLLGC